jgi:hypothetical protein
LATKAPKTVEGAAKGEAGLADYEFERGAVGIIIKRCP